MISLVEVREANTLEDYASIAHLSGIVRELQSEAALLVPRLKGRRIWMVNSTAKGGGVAEMLPKLVSILRELGVPTQWAVIGTDQSEFFGLTKRIHNLIHGHGEPVLSPEDKDLYEAVSRENADHLKTYLKPDDILIIHDPQPLGMGAVIKKALDIMAVWRCHIGLDVHLPATRAAWTFLRPYAETCDLAVFSVPEYIPDYLAGKSTVIHPGVDPLSHKNRELSIHKLVGILCNSALALEHHPVTTPSFPEPAERLQPDGSFTPANVPDEIGLMYRPIVAQISRWDKLKGFRPLMEAFVQLKESLSNGKNKIAPRLRRRLEIVRLILAGPDPASIQDDPEAKAVLKEICDYYQTLKPEIQRDVILLTLPMISRKNNALMVNVIQRCASVVVQNSLSEGFGLTVTEAMWKRTAVMGSHACGIRHQIRDGIDGRLAPNPEDPAELAEMLNNMLSHPKMRDCWGRNAQRRVHDEFLVFTQIRNWLRALTSTINRRNH